MLNLYDYQSSTKDFLTNLFETYHDDKKMLVDLVKTWAASVFINNDDYKLLSSFSKKHDFSTDDQCGIRYLLCKGFINFDWDDIPVDQNNTETYLWENLLLKNTDYLVRSLMDHAFKLYCTITPENIFGERMQSSSVTVLKTRFDLISKWFVSLILTSKTVYKQLIVVKKIIVVLKILIEKGNMQDAAAIMTCLTDKNISCLSYLFSKLSKNEKTYISDMKSLFSQKNDFANYRKYIEDKDKIIPYMNVQQSVGKVLKYQRKWLEEKPAHMMTNAISEMGYFSDDECCEKSKNCNKLNGSKLSPRRLLRVNSDIGVRRARKNKILFAKRKKQHSSDPIISPRLSSLKLSRSKSAYSMPL